jgi:hypothetical protein
MSSRVTVAEALYFATAQSGAAMIGQVTKTGTITLTQFGTQYSPAPADKLVVRLGAKVHEFEAIDAMGDSSATAAVNWLAAPHRLAYLHRMPGEAEARVIEQFDGQGYEAKVTGWAVLQGKRFTIDLLIRGAMQRSGDFDGQDIKTRSVLTGTVQGDDLKLEVQEQHATSFASATSLRTLPSMRGSASQFVGSIASVLSAGGATYRFSNVQVETGTKEKGGNTSGGLVAVSGVILRNDQPFAQCTLQNGLPVAVVGTTVIPLAGPVE